MRMMGRIVWRGQTWEDTPRTRGQVRATEKRQWRREVRCKFRGNFITPFLTPALIRDFRASGKEPK